MPVPENIRRLIAGKSYTVDTLGMSGAKIFCFEDRTLKIEKQSAESEHERRMLLWLEGRLPAPRVLAAELAEGISYLLMSRMQGEMACSPALIGRPELLARRLAEALQQLWRVDTAGLPDAAQSCLGGKLRLAEERVKKALQHGECGAGNLWGGWFCFSRTAAAVAAGKPAAGG
jgi:aminoglycoside phosphotransferase